MSRPLCIYHANCADGFTSAWIVNKALDGNVDFHQGFYGDDPPDCRGRDVIMVDFSYKRPVLEKMIASCNTMVILDHHKSAAEDLKDIEADLDGTLRITFDMERSGAGITWDHFFPGQPRPALVDYVEDRDLWRFRINGSREINAYIFSYDYTFKNWDRLYEHLATSTGYFMALVGGASIERKHHKDVAELVKNVRRTMMIGGHYVPVANLPYTLTSDAGNLMSKDAPFAACYVDTPHGRTFSLRSQSDGVDVSKIAAGYGGGGHRNAAGFRMPIGWEGDGTLSRSSDELGGPL